MNQSSGHEPFVVRAEFHSIEKDSKQCMQLIEQVFCFKYDESLENSRRGAELMRTLVDALDMLRKNIDQLDRKLTYEFVRAFGKNNGFTLSSEELGLCEGDALIYEEVRKRLQKEYDAFLSVFRGTPSIIERYQSLSFFCDRLPAVLYELKRVYSSVAEDTKEVIFQMAETIMEIFYCNLEEYFALYKGMKIYNFVEWDLLSHPLLNKSVTKH